MKQKQYILIYSTPNKAYFLLLWYNSKKSKPPTDSERAASKEGTTKTEDDDEPVVKFRTFWSCYLLLPPAMCDMIATCVMYIGLTLTSASSFQVWPLTLLT